jgi:tetratricopeptide (TPR) repeat protein
MSCIISGDYQRINHIAPTIINLIERSRTQAEFFGKSFNPYSWVCGLWGCSTGACGDFEQGERLLEKALKFALEIDHRGTIGFVEYLYGVLFAWKGDGKSAAKHLENGLKHLVESQTVLYVGQAYCWLGYAHCLMGDPKTAVDLTEKGLKLHTDTGMLVFRSVCHFLCIYAKFELGDIEEAITHAELAVKFSLENNEKVLHGLSKLSLGRVLAKTDVGQIEAAEQQLLQGISLLEELGIVAFSCWGYLWLGEVYAESGRQEEALQNLKKAEAMFRDMGMDYWLGKAQDALARL